MKTQFEIETIWKRDDAKEDFKFYVSEKVRKALREYNPEYEDNNKNDIIIDHFLNRLFDEISDS